MKVAFAREIDGGYSIISLVNSAYYVTELPAKCEKTGYPVIMSPEAHDHIESIASKTKAHISRVNRDVRQLIEKFVQECSDATVASNNNVGNVELLEKALAYQWAYVNLGRLLNRTIERKFENTPEATEVFDINFKSSVIEAALMDGYNLPEKVTEIKCQNSDNEVACVKEVILNLLGVK